MIRIKISKDFTQTPGGRYKEHGAFSGEEFRENILYPKYMEACKENKRLEIDLDGCFGFPSSFIEEAFGGLVRKIQNDDIANIIGRFVFISNDEPSLLDEIKEDMKNASKEKK